jgi:HEAT repeat protein
MSNQMDDYVEKWVGYLNASDRDMSVMAARKLAKTNDPRSVSELIHALKGRPDDIRIAAIRALGEIGSKQAVKPLVRLLHDPDPILASAAADALGAIGDKASVPALVEVLHDFKSGNSRHSQLHGFTRGVFMAAIYALERINTPEARRAIQQYHR